MSRPTPITIPRQSGTRWWLPLHGKTCKAYLKQQSQVKARANRMAVGPTQQPSNYPEVDVSLCDCNLRTIIMHHDLGCSQRLQYLRVGNSRWAACTCAPRPPATSDPTIELMQEQKLEERIVTRGAVEQPSLLNLYRRAKDNGWIKSTQKYQPSN